MLADDAKPADGAAATGCGEGHAQGRHAMRERHAAMHQERLGHK